VGTVLYQLLEAVALNIRRVGLKVGAEIRADRADEITRIAHNIKGEKTVRFDELRSQLARKVDL
jgi:hypothetical protein